MQQLNKNSRNCISMVVGDSEYIMIAQDKVGCLQQMAMLTTSIYIELLSVIKINWPLMCKAYAGGG